MPYAPASAPMTASGYGKAILLPGLVTGLLPALAGLATGFAELSLAGAVLLGAAAGDWMVAWALRSLPGDARVLDHPRDIGAQVIGDPMPPE